ncbi:MAG: M23 family metallopeptidase [Gammaproteobacteria bacterium]|jgi:murein DD-endopeptidase MepM/ murein hydrolase activator NlpD|nr:M23 family metallopeptidase [Gammaproteobacteria bacterium]
MNRILYSLVVSVVAVGHVWAGTLELEGQLMQGGLMQGRTDPDAEVTFDGQPVRISEAGVFLIGFGRDAPPQAKLVATFADGSREWRELKVGQRKYKTQRIDGLPPRKVTPSEEDLVRIGRETALIKQARAQDDTRTDFLNGFIWPAKGRITGVYGSQRILNGEPRRPHFGLDIAAPVGTPVVAPASGIVTLTHPDMFYSGGTLILDHGHGLSSTFIHLHQILVKQGDYVQQGDVIAEIGVTGRARGAHLDWRINLFTRRLDPQLILEAMPSAAAQAAN